jgi:hypothetical protein
MFRKKPVVIEAVQFLGTHREVEGEEPRWYQAARSIDRGEPGSITFSDGKLRIMTLEGEHTASPGDWIIQGVKGELYPCKPDIFAATYEPA